MITLTPAAARQIHSALEDAGDEDLALRVAARRMADGTLDYAMGFDEPRDGDLALEEKGVPLLIGAASRELLANMQIDFVEYEPGDFRFLFIAAQACSLPAAAAADAGGCAGGGCSSCRSGK